jgi:hypothetical protein
VEENRYMLLDYLFKFVECTKTPLNPVLSGYFAKLVIMLLNRKQKQIVPYLFGPNCKVIERLLFHAYQKSISEVLHKILNVSEQNYDSSLKIKERQQKIVVDLVDQLGAKSGNQVEEEASLNACTILGELIEVKDFFKSLSKKTVQSKL